MRSNTTAWELPHEPIRLKNRIAEAGKSQADIVKLILNKKGQPISRSLLNAVCKRGYLPTDVPDFKTQVETALTSLNIAVSGIWDPIGGTAKTNKRPKRQTIAGGATAKGSTRGGDGDMNWTREFLTEEEIQHFGLADDPFYEIDDFNDIYMSPQLKVVERRFMDTVKRHGIMAITGDVGAGKSTLLRHILTKLIRDKKIRAIVPDDMDREKLTGRGLTSAIISSLGAGHSPRSAVDRDRLAKMLLEQAIGQGASPVLIIDEAHDLKDQVIIALKRIWDSGLIFKLISIVIVGQGGKDENGHSWGLTDVLENNPFIREFAERCYLVDIGVLNGSMGDYLAFRFKKAGADVHKIFNDDALKLLSKKAQVPNRAHNIAVRAMRAAYKDGQTKVSIHHVNDV